METESGNNYFQSRGQQNNTPANELQEPLFCLIRGQKRIPLKFKETGIGRRSNLVIQVNDPSVMSHHATIFVDGGKVQIE